MVAKHEYVKITRKRSFLFGTLAMPMFFVAIMALAIVAVVAGEDQRPIGYVDHAGLLTTVTHLPPDEDDGPNPVDLLRFCERSAGARCAGKRARFKRTTCCPPIISRRAMRSCSTWTKSRAGRRRAASTGLVRANLSASLPPAVAERAQKGIDLTARSADGQQEVSGDSFISLLVPFFIGLFFSIVVLSSGSYCSKQSPTKRKIAPSR